MKRRIQFLCLIVAINILLGTQVSKGQDALPASMKEPVEVPAIEANLPILPPPPEAILVKPQEEETAPEKQVFVGPLTGKTGQDALKILAPLIASRSVEKTVEQFTNLSAETALVVLNELLNNPTTGFTKRGDDRLFEIKRSDMLQIIFGVASQYRNIITQRRFFELIEQYPGLKYGARPPLFVLSISSYPVLIPAFITWLREKGNAAAVRDAAYYAVDRNSRRALKALNTYAQGELEALVNELLWHAVSAKKSTKTVALLIDDGASPNYHHASGYTPLIKAVELENFPLTTLLLDKGGDIDLIVQDDVGSAWQKASEIRSTAIIEYMGDRYKRSHDSTAPVDYTPKHLYKLRHLI